MTASVQTVVSASSKDADLKADGERKSKVAGMVGELVGSGRSRRGWLRWCLTGGDTDITVG